MSELSLIQSKAISNASGAEQTKMMRKLFKKEKDWTSRDISVRNDSYSMGSSFFITIKNPEKVKDYEFVKSVKSAAECIHYCKLTQEILLGGNRFGEINFSKEAQDILGKPYFSQSVSAIVDLHTKCKETYNITIKVEGTDFYITRQDINTIEVNNHSKDRTFYNF